MTTPGSTAPPSETAGPRTRRATSTVAAAVGGVLVTVIMLGVFAQAVGFLVSVSEASGGRVTVPTAATVGASVLGVVLAVGLVVLAATRRRAAAAWLLSGAAALVALVTCAVPVVTVVSASAPNFEGSADVVGYLWRRFVAG